jgi:hypothetical protein
MSQWIVLNPDKINTARQEQINGVQVNLYLPPAGIPYALRGSYDPKIKKFVVEMNYLAQFQELCNTKHSDDGVITFEIGVVTQRINRIIVDINKVNAQGVQVSIQNAAKHIAFSALSQQGLRPNIKATMAALDVAGNEVFNELKTGTR